MPLTSRAPPTSRPQPNRQPTPMKGLENLTPQATKLTRQPRTSHPHPRNRIHPKIITSNNTQTQDIHPRVNSKINTKLMPPTITHTSRTNKMIKQQTPSNTPPLMITITPASKQKIKPNYLSRRIRARRITVMIIRTRITMRKKIIRRLGSMVHKNMAGARPVSTASIKQAVNKSYMVRLKPKITPILIPSTALISPKSPRKKIWRSNNERYSDQSEIAGRKSRRRSRSH